MVDVRICVDNRQIAEDRIHIDRRARQDRGTGADLN
jgi:hypothetical protein